MAKRVVKWFKPGIESGWKHEDTMRTRRGKALKAHKGDYLATARSLQALANVTQSSTTKRAAKKDAAYFFEKHSEEK